MSRYDYNSGKNLDIEIVVEWAEADENDVASRTSRISK